MSTLNLNTPLGRLGILARNGAVREIHFGGFATPDPNTTDDSLVAHAATQLHAYFSGQLREFTLPLEISGTEFQKKVLLAISSIPYGHTETYGHLATLLGHPHASRAVGLAAHRNPLPIVIPCHRVVGANGKLVGYSEGLYAKRFLLDLEKNQKNLFPPPCENF